MSTSQPRRTRRPKHYWIEMHGYNLGITCNAGTIACLTRDEALDLAQDIIANVLAANRAQAKAPK